MVGRLAGWIGFLPGRGADWQPWFMPEDTAAPEITVAYVLSRFPKLSETFVLDEIINVERLGAHVEIFALIHHRDGMVHDDAVAYEARADFSRPWDGGVLVANAVWLFRRPGRYLSTAFTLLWAMRRSARSVAKSLASFLQAVHYASLATTRHVEHIHAHFATHATTAAWVVGRLTEIPYSFTCHAHDVYLDKSFLARKISDARFVVAICEYVRDIVVEVEPSASSSVRVIHCGVDPERLDPGGRHPADVFTILNIGRFDPMKGHAYLLDAAAELRRRGVEFELRIVGDGPLRGEIEAKIRQLHLSSCVSLLGAQSRDVVISELYRAHVLVSSSIITDDFDTEGLPITLMESLSAGVPTVATRVAGVPELVENEVTGLLVEQRDPVALAAAIERFHDDPELAAKLSEGGRRRVIEEFDQGASSRQLLDLILSSRSASVADA